MKSQYMYMTRTETALRNCNMMGLLTKCAVEMAGYWSFKRFVCVYVETQWRLINMWKRTRLSISSHLDHLSLFNEGFIIWHKKHPFLTWTTGQSWVGYRIAHLSCQEAIHWTGFRWSCPLNSASHVLHVNSSWFLKQS